MNLKALKCMHMENPLGIDEAPFVSWQIKSEHKNVVQTAYHLKVYCGDALVWDSGKITSSQSTYVELDFSLESRKRYYWHVSVWDSNGESADAGAWFETAFLQSKEWQSEWVSAPFKQKKRRAKHGMQPPAIMFRRLFNVNGNVRRARLYATCHGVYRVYVNGNRPDERELAPEHTTYSYMLCYQTYDITSHLQQGANAIGMYVGDGWYFCPSSVMRQRGLVSKSQSVLFQLHISYHDGSEEVFGSDFSTKVSEDGPVRASDLFGGEKYDANREMDGWATPDFDDGNWQAAVPKAIGFNNLKAQHGQPIRVFDILPSQTCTVSPKGETIYDFGQNLAGKVRITVDAPKGTEFTMEHTEVLDKYGNYFANISPEGFIGGAAQKDVCICKGGRHTYEPLFTYHGFRYMRLTGITKAQVIDVQAVALSSEKEQISEFTCSNSDLVQLSHNAKWSQLSNMISIPTDCPQREKVGWTGDIQIYAATAMQMEDITPFLTRWLRNLAIEQLEDGQVPITVPFGSSFRMMTHMLSFMIGSKHTVSSGGWSDAAVSVPYTMYRATGNTRILREQYPSMKRWADYVIKQAGKGYLWKTGFQFGEWLIPSLSKSGYSFIKVAQGIKSSLKYTAPVFGYVAVCRMAETAKALGNRYDAQYYSDIAGKMKIAIMTNVYSKNGSVPIELMGAYVLGLYFDLVPDEARQVYIDKLVEMIHKNGNKLDTGFLGTPYLLDALCKNGQRDLAYQLLYQEDCPSWVYQIRNGATTIWESWYGVGEDGNPLGISYNHYAFGCVMDWIFREIVGLQCVEAGYKRFLVKPRPDESLSYARHTFNSEYGQIAVDWEKRGDNFILKLEVPCNTSAVAILPNGETHEVGSGSYCFTANSLL